MMLLSWIRQSIEPQPPATETRNQSPGIAFGWTTILPLPEPCRRTCAELGARNLSSPRQGRYPDRQSRSFYLERHASEP